MKRLIKVICLLFIIFSPSVLFSHDKVVVIPLFGSQESQSPPAPIPKTGQKISEKTGDDGDHQKGIAWPSPRFNDNNNGTVTDYLTGLIWLKKGNCAQFFLGDSIGNNHRLWEDAITAANSLKSGFCELADGSKAGDWRLPNLKELNSLIDFGRYNPALPLYCPLAGTTFSGIYWSSTTRVAFPITAWSINFYNGQNDYNLKAAPHGVRAVRGGQ